MSTQIISTPEELKQFFKTSPLTINNLSKFIEEKTARQYIIVRRAMVLDLNQQLLTNSLFILNINDILFNNWEKLFDANTALTDRWREELQALKDFS